MEMGGRVRGVVPISRFETYVLVRAGLRVVLIRMVEGGEEGRLQGRMVRMKRGRMVSMGKGNEGW